MDISACDFTNPAHRKAIPYLLNGYIKDEMGGGTALSPQQEKDLVNGLEALPGAIVYFALHDKEFVGMIVAFRVFATFAAKKAINIHDLFVDSSVRGLGAGRLLMQKIIDIAKEEDCGRISLEVREDNLVAQNLYKSLGYGEQNPPMKFWVKKF